MKNIEIIANEAVAANLYTQEQVEEILECGGELPLHTFAGWKARGKMVRKGEHAAIKTRLWKFKKGAKKAEAEAEVEEKEESRYYLCKAFLFTAEQVEAIA